MLQLPRKRIYEHVTKYISCEKLDLSVIVTHHNVSRFAMLR